MAKKKKRPLLDENKNWYKEQIDQFKDYLTDIKLKGIQDRIAAKPTKNGGVVSQVITIEEQVAHKMKMLNELPKLMSELAELESFDQEDEDKPVETRGDVTIPAIMRKE